MGCFNYENIVDSLLELFFDDVDGYKVFFKTQNAYNNSNGVDNSDWNTQWKKYENDDKYLYIFHSDPDEMEHYGNVNIYRWKFHDWVPEDVRKKILEVIKNE